MAKLTIVEPTQADKTETIETEQKKPDTGLKEHVKSHEFQLFAAWLAIPTFMKKPPRDKKTGVAPEPKDFCESLGVEDEQILELVQIPNYRAFQEKYGVHKDTLTDWKEEILQNDVLAELDIWIKPLVKNAAMSLYNQCIRGGLPEHYKLFFQIAAKWSEKSIVDVRKRSVKLIRYEIVDPKKLA